MHQILNTVKRLRPGPTGILLAALVIAAALIATRPQRPPITMPEKAWSVDVIAAEPAEMRPSLELYAQLESPQDASLSAAAEGDVLEVLVQDGDRISAGDRLLVIDDREAQLELLQRDADVQEIRAQINLEKQRLVRNRQALVKERELLQLAVSNSERASSLYKDKLVSQSNVDDTAEGLKKQELAVTSRQLAIEENEIRIQQLNAQIRRAEALRDRAQLQVDRTQVEAPFAGVISEVEVSVGDRLRLGDALMRLHNPDALELRTQLPTRFAGRVRDALVAGTPITADAELGGRVYDATLKRLSGQTREGSGSVEAYLHFQETPERVALGSTVRLVLSLPPEIDAVAVPAEAVYGRNRIYTVQGQRMVGLDVERLGDRLRPDGRSEVLIRSPQLEAGDLIITTKVSSAVDGLLVRVRDGMAGDSDAMLASGKPTSAR